MELDNTTKCVQSVPYKKDFIMEKINRFYKERENLETILPILNGKSKISLRLIDWFVTNYAKKYNTKIIHTDNISNIKQFIVFLNYKAQLKAYTKKQFDPFCRRERLRFFYNNKDFIITTVGQLNFFKWAIENEIIQYIRDHLQLIENDMNQNVKKIKSKDTEIRKKRQELSISASKTLNKHNITMTVSFE